MNTISRNQLTWLCLAQGLALLPLFFVLPLWLAAFWLIAAGWRIHIYRKNSAFPHFLLKAAVALVGIVGLLITIKNPLSVEAFVAFFLISFALKLIELRQKDDGLLVVCVSFVSLGASFLFYQTFLIVLYVVFALFFLMQAWVSLYRERSLSFSAQLKKGALLVLQSLPLMVILFVTLPRMGQLWSMPSQTKVGQTGFSDSMSPGDFSDLIESDAVAFRVTFNSKQIPSPENRYWRALVFESFDGRKWSRGEPWRSWGARPKPANKPHSEWGLSFSENTPEYHYSVLLEPHQQPWLFTLMAPVKASSSSLNLLFTPFTTLRSRIKVANRTQYNVSSVESYNYNNARLSSADRRVNLSLPESGNDQTREWGNVLSVKSESDVVKTVLDYFRSTFVYTLKPPLLGSNSVDDFLFGSQRGFCEHFSSSFVFLMRAAGIPARVVVGYQGGELNPIENYMIIRQRDAHAWAEIWLEGKGWVRVDPTAAVAPSRIERGLRSAVDDSELGLIGGINSGVNVIHWLQLRLDAFSYTWQRFVISYDNDVQNQFFKRFLGGTDAWRIGVFFLGGGGCILLCFFLYSIFPMNKPSRFRENKPYRYHLNMLAKHGFHKGKNETPSQFALRVSHEKPEWKQDLIRVACGYNCLAYSRESEVTIEGFTLLCKKAAIK